MRRGDDGIVFLCQTVKPSIPQLPRPVFAGVGRDGYPRFGGIEGMQQNAVLPAKLRHKGGVRIGGSAAQPVVDVRRLHGDLQALGVSQQKQQQSHGVCPAGAGRNDSAA